MEGLNSAFGFLAKGKTAEETAGYSGAIFIAIFLILLILWAIGWISVGSSKPEDTTDTTTTTTTDPTDTA